MSLTSQEDASKALKARQIGSGSNFVPTDYITKLPNELLSHIFSYLPIDYPRRGGIYYCCLVSRRFNTIATPLLYHTLSMLYKRSRIDQRVLSRPALGPETRPALGPETRLWSGSIPNGVEDLPYIRPQSLDCVRNIDVHTWDSIGNYQKSTPTEDIVDSLGPIVEVLLQRSKGQISSISLGSSRFLRYIPKSHFPAITRLNYHIHEGDLISSAARLSLLDDNVLPCLRKLKSLIISGIDSNCNNIPIELILRAGSEDSLKSLQLEATGNLWSSDENKLAFALDNHEMLHSPVTPRVLESLSLQEIASLDDVAEAFHRLFCIYNLITFKVVDCPDSSDFVYLNVPQMKNLANLYLKLTEEGLDIGKLLRSMDTPLRSLHLIISLPNWLGWNFVLTDALINHSSTLERLWFEPCLLIKSDQWYNTIDMLQLSQFPVLKYLALRFPQRLDFTLPFTGHFSCLESFHLLNRGGIFLPLDIRGEEGDCRMWFAKWFVSCYNFRVPIAATGHLGVDKLKAISCVKYKYDVHAEPRTVAFLQLPEQPNELSPIEHGIIDVGFYYPEIRDFIESG
ncbi:hypothetical protein TWF730_006940 [Orbilia blumenaviensis]|uniref:F-box domain-containing protein n=1 Tax=Orbilia blumenaviensis TaxID=1796055 RepID=A0AAV9VG93_9PEZI